MASAVLEMPCKVEADSGAVADVTYLDAITIGMINHVKNNPTPKNVSEMLKILEKVPSEEVVEVDYVDHELDGKAIE